jgi:hypothetical protein
VFTLDLGAGSTKDPGGVSKIQDQVPAMIPFDVDLSKSLYQGNQVICLGSLLQDDFSLVKAYGIAVLVQQAEFFFFQRIEQGRPFIAFCASCTTLVRFHPAQKQLDIDKHNIQKKYD